MRDTRRAAGSFAIFQNLAWIMKLYLLPIRAPYSSWVESIHRDLVTFYVW